MTNDEHYRAGSTLQDGVALASLGTFAVANAAGVWLAALLIWPGLGALAGPLTYGRWVPLHMDIHLFGWCSLPAIGMLLRHMLPPGRTAARHATLAVTVWCGALAAGAISWLSGDASGKLFLNWNGPVSFVFAGAQLFLWGTLVSGLRARWRLGLDRTARRVTDVFALTFLLLVPFALFFASQPQVQPPVNPDSGGATGHSLLASSLGMVGLGLVLPFLFGRKSAAEIRRSGIVVAAAYLGNWAVYALINHGNASNHDPAQIGALATLLAWPPLLMWWFRKFDWHATHRRWLLASAFWAVFLVIDGLVLFLPDVLVGAKFTHTIVAHAHLAMAGLLTSLNVLMLISLAPDTKLSRALAGRGSWLAWNLACLGMVVALTVLGWFEAGNPLLVPYGGSIVRTIYVIRLVLGAVMFGAGVHWLMSALRCRGKATHTAMHPARSATPTHAHAR